MLNAWETLAPGKSFGGMTLAQFQAAAPPAQETEHCSTALRAHHAYTDETNETFQSFAAAYTAEEAMQERIIKDLWRKLKA